MKKIGILALALVMALGALGIGYAHWTETLNIKGTLTTGYIDVNFMSQYDNDDSNQIDPTEAGEWDFTGDAPVWSGDRLVPEKDVASTSSTYTAWDQQAAPTNPTGNFATILVANGYPSYWGSVAWDIKNHGNVPVELWTVTLVSVETAIPPAIAKDKDLEIGVRYYVDADTGRVNETLQAGDDFSFILSAHGTEQLDPSSWNSDTWNTTAYLDVTVHIEQDAGQKSSYGFTIDYLFANWNEVDGVTPDGPNGNG